MNPPGSHLTELLIDKFPIYIIIMMLYSDLLYLVHYVLFKEHW